MRRYIKQIDRDEFIYPNNSVSNYDNEIIHEVNDNYPSGVVDSIIIDNYTINNLSITIYLTYQRNNSELFKNIGGEYTIISFHLLAPNQLYFKPWKYIGRITTSDLYITGNTSTISFDLVPSDLGLTGFTSGEYYLETRFIGKRSIQAVCSIFEVILSPEPTPTMTPTPTITPTSGYTPTPTPTPTPAVTPSSSAIYIGFDQQTGLLNLESLGDNVIDITISGSSRAYQSWINCNYPPGGYANMDYYIDTSYISAYVSEASATSSNRDTMSQDIDVFTFTGITSGSTQSLTININTDSSYCGDCWGICDLKVTNITKTSGSGTILIDPTNYWFWTQNSIV